jgi:nitroreductase
VIKTKGKEKILNELFGQWGWFTQAPIVICICAIPSKAWSRADGKNYSDVDAAIAFDHLVLAATKKGLGTCWVAKFDASKAKKLLGIEDGIELVAFTPLGYPAAKPVKKNRKTIKQLVEFVE